MENHPIKEELKERLKCIINYSRNFLKDLKISESDKKTSHEDDHLNWKFKSGQLLSLCPLNPNDALIFDLGDSLWKITLCIAHSLKEIKNLVVQIERVQTDEENTVEALSIQDQNEIQSLVQFIISYGIRYVVHPGFKSIISDKCLNNLVSKESLEVDLNEKQLKLSYLLNVIVEFSKDKNDVFIRFIRGTSAELLAICFIEFIYRTIFSSSSSSDELHFYLIESQSTLKSVWLSQISQILPLTTLISTLSRTAAFKTEVSPWAESALNDLIIYPTLLTQISKSYALSSQNSQIPLHSSVEILTTLLKLALLRSNYDERVIISLGAQLVELVTNDYDEKLSEMGLGLCLNISSLLTIKNKTDVGNRVIWEQIFGPWIQILVNRDAEVECSKYLECVKYAERMIKLPREYVEKILRFQQSWTLIFSTYVALCNENSKMVKEIHSDEYDKVVQSSFYTLKKFTWDLINTIFTSSTSKISLLEFIIALITNNNSKSIKSSKNDPIIITLLSQNSYPFINRCLTYDKDSLGNEIKISVKYLVSLLVENCEKSNDYSLLQSLFSQLIEFESCYKLSLDEIKLEDEKNGEICQVAGMLLLAEFDEYEDLIDKIIIPQNPENSVDHLMLLLKRLKNELEFSPTKNSEFEFAKSLIMTVELLETFTLTLIEESSKNSLNFHVLSPSTSSCKNIKNKTSSELTWEKLENCIPYLQIFSSLNFNLSIFSGLKSKCEDLIICIRTRGRGVDKKIKVEQESYVQSCILSIGSAESFICGGGFVTLKKLLKEPKSRGEIEGNLDGILEISLRELEREDEYVVGHCINFIASLAVEFHSKIIVRLVEAYINPSTSKKQLTREVNEEFETQFRLKLGEALTKTFSNLGPLGAYYKQSVLNACFTLVKNREEWARVSSFQLLSSLLPHLGLTLNEIISQVWALVEQGLKIETSLPVQRAAFLVIPTLLKALSQTHQIQDDSAIFIRDIYRFLKTRRDSDSVIVSIIDNSLAQINKLTQSLFENAAYNNPESMRVKIL